MIGCGRAGTDLHLPALARIEEAEAVAVADPSPEALSAAGDHFGISRRSSDYRDLLADPSIDVICVAAPSDLHTEIVLAAIDAGKHLFVEKPLALTVSDCDLLVERAAASRVRTIVGFNLRWHRHVRSARQLIRQGALGDPRLLTSTTASASLVGAMPRWRADAARGGGMLAMQTIHHLDLWRFLLGQEIEEIACTVPAADDPQMGPVAAAIAATTDGGIEISTASCSVTGQENGFAVYGSEAWLRASLYSFDAVEIMPRGATPGDIRRHLRRPARFLSGIGAALPNLRRGGDFRATHQLEWRHFAEAIRSDGPVECDFEEGQEATRILEAVLEASRTGSTVRVGEAAAA